MWALLDVDENIRFHNLFSNLVSMKTKYHKKVNKTVKIPSVQDQEQFETCSSSGNSKLAGLC